MTVTNKETKITFSDTLEELNKITSVITFNNKDCKITVKSEEEFSTFKFEKDNKWSYSVFENNEDGERKEQATPKTFNKRNDFPIISFVVSYDCDFKCKDQSSLQKTHILLKGGSYSYNLIDNDDRYYISGRFSNSGDSETVLGAYKTYIENVYNPNVRFFSFEGFKSNAPFYFSSGKHFDITLIGKEDDDNIIPIHLDDTFSYVDSLYLYVKVDNTHHEVKFDHYMKYSGTLYIQKAERIVPSAELTHVILNKYVIINSIESEFVVHFKTYFRITNFPALYVIQNDNKVLDVNSSTYYPPSILFSDYTINIHLTLDSFLDFSGIYAIQLISDTYLTYDPASLPKINLIFEDEENTKLQDYLNHFYEKDSDDCPSERSELGGRYPIAGGSFEYYDYLNEFFSIIGGAEMKFKDQTVQFRFYPDYQFRLNRLSENNQLSDIGSQTYGDSNSVYILELSKVEDNDSGLPGWAIALIVIACLIVVAAIVVLVIFLVKRKGSGGAASQGEAASA